MWPLLKIYNLTVCFFFVLLLFFFSLLLFPKFDFGILYVKIMHFYWKFVI